MQKNYLAKINKLVFVKINLLKLVYFQDFDTFITTVYYRSMFSGVYVYIYIYIYI